MLRFREERSVLPDFLYKPYRLFRRMVFMGGGDNIELSGLRKEPFLPRIFGAHCYSDDSAIIDTFAALRRLSTD